MKLAICIPAYNEEQTIGLVIQHVPAKISGISEQKIFVIDDGSSDKTADVGRHIGAEVIRNPHQGLAHAFITGIQKALEWGADIVVNIDADGQYKSEEIPFLIAPLLRDEADMVIGNRQVRKLKFMPWPKKYGNMVGSWFLRCLAGFTIQDASSGFRAYSRKAALQFKITSTHTYTHENLLQAHALKLRILEVPVSFLERAPGSSSRLIKNVLKHILKSLRGILRAWWRYR